MRLGGQRMRRYVVLGPARGFEYAWGAGDGDLNGPVLSFAMRDVPRGRAEAAELLIRGVPSAG